MGNSIKNFLQMTITLFAIIPFSIIYFCWLFGFYDALKDFLEKCFWFIIIAGLLYKLGVMFWDWCSSRSIDYSPTPDVEVQNSEARGATVQESNNSQPGSRGFDFTKYKQGSPEAANAYKQSQEHREATEKLRTLDELIDAAKKIEVTN